MESKEILGKKIMEIRFKNSTTKNEGNFPLENIQVQMKLSTNEIITFPNHPEAKNIKCDKFNSNLNRIFPKKKFFSLFQKNTSLRKLENQAVIGIWSIEDDFGEEICSMEFQNGFFLVKGPMSPIGVGNANLFLFESRKQLSKKYSGEIKKVY